MSHPNVTVSVLKQLAERALARIEQLDHQSWSWRIEKARIFWAKGEQETAKHLLKELLVRLQQVEQQQSWCFIVLVHVHTLNSHVLRGADMPL